MAHEAGKGDAPRKTRDDNAYSDGWDRIFGANRAKETKGNFENQSSEKTKHVSGFRNHQESGKT